MRRSLPALLAAALLALPATALAHDPLDDVSGEEDLTPKQDDKPKSHKKESQEQDLAKEVQERDDTEFHLNQEKDDFLRDRGETREVLDGQRRRTQLAGSAGHSSRPTHDAPPPHHEDAEPAPKPAPKPDAPPRGDVDPTENTAQPEVTGGGSSEDAPAPKKKKKKPAPKKSDDDEAGGN